MRLMQAYKAHNPQEQTPPVRKPKGLKDKMKVATSIDELQSLAASARGCQKASADTQRKWERTFNLRYAQLKGEVKS